MTGETASVRWGSAAASPMLLILRISQLANQVLPSSPWISIPDAWPFVAGHAGNLETLPDSVSHLQAGNQCLSLVLGLRALTRRKTELNTCFSPLM